MSMLCKQQLPIFGPVAPDRLTLRGIRFFAATDGEGAGGAGSADEKSGEKGGGEKSNAGDGEKTFTQADVDKIVADRVARAKKAAEKSAEKADEKSGDKDSGKGDEPKSLTQADVDKAIADALAAKDKELAVERAGDALDKALEGRVYSASTVRKLDLEQFVNEDGKTVDTKKLNAWVEKHSTEGERPKRRDPGQGKRGSASTGGSVSAGRDLFQNEKKPKNKKE